MEQHKEGLLHSPSPFCSLCTPFPWSVRALHSQSICTRPRFYLVSSTLNIGSLFTRLHLATESATCTVVQPLLFNALLVEFRAESIFVSVHSADIFADGLLLLVILTFRCAEGRLADGDTYIHCLNQWCVPSLLERRSQSIYILLFNRYSLPSRQWPV